MLKKDLILKNPLRAWEPDTGHNTATPRMGLVVAPRGAGKTAVLVQFALDSVLRGNRVIHVSIGQSLEKTKEWYEDLFQELSRSYKLEHVGEVHSEIAANRLIMTFNTGSFSAAKLEERLTDLIEQDIFRPREPRHRRLRLRERRPGAGPGPARPGAQPQAAHLVLRGAPPPRRSGSARSACPPRATASRSSSTASC